MTRKSCKRCVLAAVIGGVSVRCSRRHEQATGIEQNEQKADIAAAWQHQRQRVALARCDAVMRRCRGSLSSLDLLERHKHRLLQRFLRCRNGLSSLIMFRAVDNRRTMISLNSGRLSGKATRQLYAFFSAAASWCIGGARYRAASASMR